MAQMGPGRSKSTPLESPLPQGADAAAHQQDRPRGGESVKWLGLVWLAGAAFGAGGPGRHLFVGHFLRTAREGEDRIDYWTDASFDLQFDPSLRGEAELVGITDSFAQCEGGQADYDARSGVLSVRFHLGRSADHEPSAGLRLVFGLSPG